MKKIIAVVMCMVFAMSFASCSGNLNFVDGKVLGATNFTDRNDMITKKVWMLFSGADGVSYWNYNEDGTVDVTITSIEHYKPGHTKGEKSALEKGKTIKWKYEAERLSFINTELEEDNEMNYIFTELDENKIIRENLSDKQNLPSKDFAKLEELDTNPAGFYISNRFFARHSFKDEGNLYCSSEVFEEYYGSYIQEMQKLSTMSQE